MYPRKVLSSSVGARAVPPSPQRSFRLRAAEDGRCFPLEVLEEEEALGSSLPLSPWEDWRWFIVLLMAFWGTDVSMGEEEEDGRGEGAGWEEEEEEEGSRWCSWWWPGSWPSEGGLWVGDGPACCCCCCCCCC